MPTLVLTLLLAVQESGHDWPTFLGPDHNGVSQETGLLAAWPEGGPPVVWKRELGEGYSAPSVAQGTLALFHRVGNEEVIEALDPRTGKPKWRFAYPTAYQDPFGYSGGPRSAPTIDSGKVYTLGAEGKLHCLELESGKPVWSRSLQDEYFKEPRLNFFGVGGAPRIDGNALLLNLGDDRAGCVTALDKATGKTLWRIGDDGASYSTPVCADVGGERIAFFLTREGGLACAVADGAVRWRYPFRSRERYSANAASPVLIGDRLFLTASYGVGAALLGTDGREVWRNQALGAHWATPVAVDGHLYGFDGRHDHEATLRCVRLSDGELLWSKKGYGRGSLIRADGRFILLSEDGRLVLADLSPREAREISSAQVLAAHCWAAPVLSRGLLYVASHDHASGKGLLLALMIK